MSDSPILKLLVLCAGDPDSEKAFSGSARGLIQALERRGCVVHKQNVLGFSDPFSQGSLFVKVLRKLDRFGWMANYRHSATCLARNTRRAMAIVNGRSDFNACLMYGTRFHPKPDVPMYCYFDATVAQVAKAGGWTYGIRTDAQNQKSFEYQKNVFDDCTGIFPRTDYAADSVYQDYEVPRSKITVAGAGSNHNITPYSHGSYNNKNILFIGVQFERKGGPLILEAFRLVRQKIPEVTLTIIGGELDIDEPGVEVVGRIYKDQGDGLNRILEFYSRASLFCIMSIIEPFGIVVLEAQNSFVPCIVPKRFAFTETVKNEITGVHLVDETPEGLSKVMEELLNDPVKLKQMGEAAHEFVQREWTWDRAAERIEKRIRQDLVV
jgi:glycosyltransferase involved in cell wall biosynthesis